MELRLVADTNLFFECKALDQLPWLELGADPIVILLTKPVLDEIDKHKTGSGRTRGRALAIYGRVRDMLRSSAKEVEIQASFPRVLLRRETVAKPDPALAEDLNYTKTDEMLIGITSALKRAASGAEVKLFTDDTGPAATADALGVPYLLIDEGWRRPPAETTEQKRIKDLEKDLATYRAQEPSIAIVCQGTDSSCSVVVTNRRATPLAEAEVEAFVERLRLKHPLKIDFTPPEPKTVSTRGVGTTKTEYAPPESDAIAKYRDREYPAWIERCRQTLRTLHVGRDQIERSVKLRWSMSNEGTRPGSRVRVEFEAKGPLELKRIREPDDKHDTAQKEPPSAQSPAALPLPPNPPAFQITTTHLPPGEPRVVTSDFYALRREIERATASLPLAKLAQQAAFDAKLRAQLSGLIDPGKSPFDPILTQVGPARRSPFEALKEQELAQINRTESWTFAPPPTNLSSLLSRRQRDPEDFYYDWPDDELVKKGALTCELWRHRSDPEIFDFEVVFIGDGEASGLVECTVHAENLTLPVRKIVKVSRTIGSVGMLDLAKTLIEACG